MPNLILRRHLKQAVFVCFGDQRVKVTVVGISMEQDTKENPVRLSFEADSDVLILREELARG